MNYIKNILIFTFLPIISLTQSNFFEWGEGYTYFKGKLDTSKYTIDEIKLIHNYLYSPNSEMLTIGNIWKIEQMDTATTTQIDKYYNKTLTTLETMKKPKGDFWDSLLIYRKKELFEVCQNNRVFILALHNPQVLYDFYKVECADAIIALTSDEKTLLEEWKKLIEKQKRMNGDPKRLEKKYQTELSSVNHLKYARLDIMQFGWGNCMNNFVYHHSDYIRIEEEFQKLFLSVEILEYED